MKKTLIRSLAVFFIGFSGILPARAEQPGEYFYYLLPPLSSVSVNDSLLDNKDSEQGKMIFHTNVEEKIVVSPKNIGFKIVSKHLDVDVKPESALTVANNMVSLLAGSVHVMTLSTVSGQQIFQLGNLSLRFQSADFLAYISSDETQVVVKVLEGEVTIENPETNQVAVLKGQQMTSSDASGKLLVPFPLELSANNWWEGERYRYAFEKLPLANAGEDQRVVGNIPVVLDGSKSSFITGDIFEWELLKGPKDPDGQQITGVSFNSTYIQKPLFTPVVDGEYRFSLRITNKHGQKSNIDEVVIYVGKDFIKPIAIFPDVPADHPNNLAITYLYKKNVLNGSEDPITKQILFRPEDSVNRVEILKTLFENKKQKLPSVEELQVLASDELFLDVKVEHWFAPYVYAAKKMNVVKGNNGLYRPADEVLLVEALKMIVETNNVNSESFRKDGERPYPDAEADAWYSPYLFFAKAYNLIDVDGQGRIKPAQPLTRAKFAEIVYRMESINLLEKRSLLNGVLKESKSKKGIADGEIYVYNVKEETISGAIDEGGFVKKGTLYFKTTTRKDGSFSISLPAKVKYYLEAIHGDTISNTRVVVELEENKPTAVELELAIVQ